jgi:hypothetical protein
MVQILLEAGAAVAAVCKQGETPLRLACNKDDFEVSEYSNGLRHALWHYLWRQPDAD